MLILVPNYCFCVFRIRLLMLHSKRVPFMDITQPCLLQQLQTDKPLSHCPFSLLANTEGLTSPALG